MRSDEVLAMLRERHPAPEWVLCFEVANGTGSNASRYADAVAMNCFPSKGLELIGYEVKVTRGDWLRELKASDKSVAVAAHCDRWYIAAPADVVKREELPVGWGLVIASESGLRVAVQPPPNEAVKPVTRSFMASMLRRAGGTSEATIKETVARAVEVAKAQERARARDNDVDKRFQERHEELARKLAEFEAASGLSIRHGWDLPQVGEAVRELKEVNRLVDRLSRFKTELAAGIASIDAVTSALSEIDRTLTTPTPESEAKG